MDNKEKILVTKEIVEKIKSGLHFIRLTSKEKAIQKEATTLVKLLEDETNMNNSSLEERIVEKMKETKGTDPDMNANLYILHRKLINGQISEQQALELFETYAKSDKSNKGFF